MPEVRSGKCACENGFVLEKQYLAWLVAIGFVLEEMAFSGGKQAP